MKLGGKFWWTCGLLFAGVAVWLSRTRPETPLNSLTSSNVLPPLAEERSSPRQPPRRHETVLMGSPEVAPAIEPSGLETNRLLRILIHGESPEPPSPEEIARWLELNRTNAASLLAVRQAGGGIEYLRQALAAYPNDPRVLFSALTLDDDPESKRKRLDRFKEVAPDNSLADYVSARDHFRNGQSEAALQDLINAATKSQFNDYMTEAIQNTEELYLSTGKTPVEAKVLSSTGALLPHLSQLKGLAQDIAGLQQQYLAAGDPESATTLATYGMQLSQDLASGEGSATLIGQLVGQAIERIVISPLDRSTYYDFLGTTVDERLGQLDAQRASMKADTALLETWLPTASEADLAIYFERFKLFGETGAAAWLRQRQGESPSQ